MKCSNCGKEIKNVYYFFGKAYGYNCYKEQVAMYKANLTEKHNEEWIYKCSALMNVFSSTKDNNFKKSILEQWNNYNKLSAKQYNVIWDKFNPEQRFNYFTTLLELVNEENDLIEWCEEWIENIIRQNQEVLYKYKDDKRVLDIIKSIYNTVSRKGIERIKAKYIVSYLIQRYSGKKEIRCYVMAEKNSKERLDDLREDEDVSNLEIKEIQ